MTTRPVMPPEYVQSYTRAALMEGATKAVAERGVEAKIADLVKAARRARKTLYDNYPGGKDELLRATLRWLADGLFTAYTAGGADAAEAWAHRQPEGIVVLLRYGHLIDPAYMLELGELAAECLQLPQPVVDGALTVLRRADREGNALAVLPELEAFVNNYREEAP